MSDNSIKLVFSTYEYRAANSEQTILPDIDTIERILYTAIELGLKTKESHEFNRVENIPNFDSEEHPKFGTDVEEEYGTASQAYWIPPDGAQEIWHVIEVVCVGATGAVVFLRNLLGTLNDLNNLRKGKTLKVKVGGEERTLNNIADFQAIIDELENGSSNRSEKSPKE
ncbi:hypothetical protein [Rhizobium straminoryzae]|uniref:Uncharacterized protein n=1 Tax=Rhizobium straminoryzae TaxID=1387186 RepID=A0A549T0X1_9HYPH|nr:hypothetical protein [Rhizobium straminoryzae]TRL35525.1 hypothetical protein FNA46_20220 [Rhizobium straminoryzae]